MAAAADRRLEVATTIFQNMVREELKLRMRLKKIGISTSMQGILTLRTWTAARLGSAMIPAAPTFTIAWIIRGSMATSPVASGVATCGILAAVVRDASGLAGSFSQSLLTMLDSATAGYGIRMTSSSMTIPTTLAGTWRTT